MKEIQGRQSAVVINKGFNTKKTESLIQEVIEDEFALGFATGKVVNSTPRIKEPLEETYPGRYNLRPRRKIEKPVVHIKENVLEKNENDPNMKQLFIRGKNSKLVHETNKKEPSKKLSTKLRSPRKIKSEPVEQPAQKKDKIGKKNIPNAKSVVKLQRDDSIPKVTETKVVAAVSRGLKRKHIELSEQPTKRQATVMLKKSSRLAIKSKMT